MGQLPYRVLIVDDDPMVRDLATRNFVRLGFLCDTAEDGQAAATKCAANDYDAVVTDLKMPNRNGHSLAVELLEQPLRPVVVVATAIIESRISRDLVARGIDRIVQKPVDHFQLAGSLRTLMQSRRARLQRDVPTAKAASQASTEPDNSPSHDVSAVADSNQGPHGLSDREFEINRSHRVLVVDDEPTLRALAQRSFTGDGFECDTAEDGCVAAKMFAARSYDAVVTDVRMPVRNGHALAAEILNHRPLPVVVIATGIIESQLSNDLMKRGAALVMHKPLDYSRLTTTIRELLSRRPETSEDYDSCGHQLDSPDATSDEPPQIANGLKDESVDLYLRCTSIEHDPDVIAEWVESDPELRNRVIKQANASKSEVPLPPSGSTLQAVIRIGPKRVGQLALMGH